jgi:hypothetical protein
VFQVQPHQKAGNRLKREGLRYEAVVEVGDAPDDVGTAQVRGSSA